MSSFGICGVFEQEVNLGELEAIKVYSPQVNRSGSASSRVGFGFQMFTQGSHHHGRRPIH